MRTLEFLYFYLMPETPAKASSAPNTAIVRSPAKDDHAQRQAHTYSDDGGGSIAVDMLEHTRGTDEKQVLLGKHLNNVAELVADLKESSPFGSFIV